MRVIGIDPGSNATGWAIVSRHGGAFALHGAGVIRTNADDPMGSRLNKIFTGLQLVLTTAEAESAAIEAIFRHRSSESALRLGQARGVALLALAQAGLEVSEFNPMTVKKTVTGSGKAEKAQVALMVARRISGADGLPADAADAAAIALTHLASSPLRALMKTRMP